jgi:hypothetical protein
MSESEVGRSAFSAESSREEDASNSKDVIIMNVLTVNLLFSTLVFWIAARLYLFPKLDHLEPRSVLLPILLLHSLRHLGLMFLAPGATYEGIPSKFIYPAAFGDLLAAVLALAAIPAVAQRWKSGRLLVWIFNVAGTVDLFTAITLATIYRAAPYMGAAYWIPAFWVPALLVTHYVTFVVLIKSRKDFA